MLFVSHNMTAVKALCQRGILIDSGKIIHEGDSSAAIDNYLDTVALDIREIPLSERTRDKNVSQKAKMTGLKITSDNVDIHGEVDSTKPVEMVLDIQVLEKTRFACQIQIRDQYRTIVLFSSELQQNEIFDFNRGIHKIICKCSPLFLASGRYWITCGLASGPHEWIDYVFDAYTFHVKNVDIYQNGFNYTQSFGLFHVNHRWETK